MTEQMNKTMIPVDPNARVMHFLSVPRGVQSLIKIDGCSDLVYIVNPTDGRLPFIVMKSDENDPGITHRFQKPNESEETDDHF